MTTRTNDQIVTAIAQACWFAGISHQALITMPTPTLVEFLTQNGLTLDELIVGMRAIGRHAQQEARLLRAYADSHGHA